MTDELSAKNILEELAALPELLDQVRGVIDDLEGGTLSGEANAIVSSLQEKLVLLRRAGQEFELGDMPWSLDSLSSAVRANSVHAQLIEELHTLRINLEVIEDNLARHYERFLEDYDALQSGDLVDGDRDVEACLLLLLEYIHSHATGEEAKSMEMEERVSSAYSVKIERHIRHKHLTTSNEDHAFLLAELGRTSSADEEEGQGEAVDVKEPGPRIEEKERLSDLASSQASTALFGGEPTVDFKHPARTVYGHIEREEWREKNSKSRSHRKRRRSGPNPSVKLPPQQEESSLEAPVVEEKETARSKSELPEEVVEEASHEEQPETSPPPTEGSTTPDICDLLDEIDTSIEREEVESSTARDNLNNVPLTQTELGVKVPPTFDDFVTEHWLTRERTVDVVPWRLDEWNHRLVDECERLIEQISYPDEDPEKPHDRFLAQLWIHAGACDENEVGSLVLDTMDVEQIHALRALFVSVIPLRPADQSVELFRLFVEPSFEHSDKAIGRFKLVLEALAPRTDLWGIFESKSNLDLILSNLAGDRYIDLVLKWLLTERLLKARSADACLRDLNHGNGDFSKAPTETELVEQIEDQRRSFHEFIKVNWQACGGKIQRTHCREAWTRFVEEYAGRWEAIYPPEEGGNSTLNDTKALRALCDHMMVRYTEIADAKDVKFQDRTQMNRVAEELVNRIRRLCDRVEDLERARKAKGGGYEGEQSHQIDSRELQQAYASQPASSFDRLARLLIQRRLKALLAPEAIEHEENETSAGPLRVGTQLIWLVPELLRLGVEVQLDESGILNTGELRELAQEPRLLQEASALVLEYASISRKDDIPAVIDEQTISQRIADLGLLERLGTYLERLRGGNAHRLTNAHINHEDHRDRLYLEHSALRTMVSELTSLSSASAPLAVKFLEALDGLKQEDADVWIGRFEIIEEWTSRIKNWVTYEREQALQSLRARAPEGSELGEALDKQNYERALMLLSRGESRERVPALMGRTSSWRNDAPNLSDIEESLGSEERSLMDAWRDPNKDGNKLRSLRNKFTQVTFGVGQELVEGSSNVLGGERLYEFQQRLRRNETTFLPIVDSLDRIEVITPEQTNLRKLQQLIENTKGEQTAYFYLLPSLEPETRHELIGTAKRNRSLVAILDDADLARLISCSRPELAIFEILLEQQPLDRVNPFNVFEGSRTSMSMFVGRRTQASDMANTPLYTRLFSGRKLGKTALLKYIAATYDGVRRSGLEDRELRVVYVSIAGVDNITSFRRFLFEALGELEHKFETSNVSPDAHDLDLREEDEIERLLNYLRRYLERHSDKDFLVVLDEADMFVESELKAYEKDKEKCLTFQLRSNFNAGSQERGERIRFVFSGYRTTNTRSGTWANWGDVLMLDPLQPQEAEELISVPFARMGIDVTDHAEYIAYQCGYQPAILLRFGNRLVAHLNRHKASKGARTRVKVQAADVRKAFHDQHVREEIRTVVENNFQGNPGGLMVFRALLAAFEDLPPASSLERPERTILEILKHVAAHTNDSSLEDWIGQDEPSQLSAIQNHLREFQERSLIRMRTPVAGKRAISLKYPHHLPILIEQDVRERIRSAMQQPRVDIPFTFGRTLLGRAAVDNLNVLLEIYEDDPHPVFFASAWRAPFVELVGLPQRFGSRWEAWDKEQRVFGFDSEAPLSDEALERLTKKPTNEIQFALCEIEQLRNVSVKKPGDFLKYLPVLTEDDLAWWFTRVRGFEFDTRERSGPAVIHEQTGGIPWFVGHWDRLILDTYQSSDTLGQDAVKLLTERWEQEKVPILRKEYKQKLSAREQQLLEAIVRLWEEGIEAGDELEPLLADPELSGLGEEALKLSSRREDRQALMGLALWGLILLEPNTTFDAPRYAMGEACELICDVLGLG